MSHNPASDTVTAQQSPPAFNFAPVYQGVDLACQSWPYALDPAAEEKCRLQNVNVARVDLLDPGISFYTTPASDPSCANQTIGRTCTEFLQENPAVLLAINANFSWYEGQDVPGVYFALFGLAMSNGDVVCDPSVVAWQTSDPGCVDVPDETWVGAVALLITPDNHASIQTVTAKPPFDTSPYQTAIAGSAQPLPNTTWPPQKPVPGPRQVLVNGLNKGVPQAVPVEKVAGRTGVGLSQDGNILYLLTIDGLEEQGDYGADFYDLGAWLQLAGAYNGLNLDGGGSTTMARREPNNAEPILVNQPHGNETSAVVERAVGNFFGVIAPWLQ